MSEPANPHRRVRSFVRREGRLTPGQAHALEKWLPEFGIPEDDKPLDLAALFERDAPTLLEIGFGNGDALLEMAADHPEWNFIGIEVHRPGVGRLLMNAGERGLTNIRVSGHDAMEVLEHQVPDASLERVMLYFPDPWPKKRHHKRRIVRPEFVQRIARKLKAGAEFHLATDWEHYAEHMLEVMDSADAFRNLAGKGNFSPRPADRPLTKFEQRGQRLGHGVWDLVYARR